MSGFLSAGIVGGPDIPDEQDLQARCDFREEDGSAPVSDLTSNGYDQSGTYTGLTSVSGVQAGEYDGIDDFTQATWTPVSQPVHIFILFKLDSVTGGTFFYSGGSTREGRLGVQDFGSGDVWSIDAGSTADTGVAADTNLHIMSVLLDGSNSTFRLDGTDYSIGSPATNSVSGSALGADGSGSNNADCSPVEVLVYPEDKTSKQSEIEQYIDRDTSILP